jgi:tRNA A-37 threonylcarbamoyl transferase component Bud32
VVPQTRTAAAPIPSTASRSSASSWPGLSQLRRGRRNVVGLAGLSALVAALQLVAVVAEWRYGWLATGPFVFQVALNAMLIAGSSAIIVFARTRADHRSVVGAAMVGWLVLVSGYAIGAQHHDLSVFGHANQPSAAMVVPLMSVILPMPQAAIRAWAAISGLILPLGLVMAGVITGADVRSELPLVAFVGVGTAVISILVSRLVQELVEQPGTGRRLGSYVIEDRLGQGGMGEVYRARHTALDAPAALKLVRADALATVDPASAEVLARRFEREARATARLTSPHAVRLLDFGVDDDGTFFTAMELLDGFDLERLVRLDGPQPPERVVYLLLGACHALAEAHDKGLVHRDVKPSNLFVCRRGLDVDVVKVLDFGLVGLQPDRADPSELSGTGRMQLTHRATLVGTPAFAAPELALDPATADGRADVYGLCCVAFWLLTGHRPFDALTAEAQVAAHLSEAPRRPSTFRSVPPALDDLVLDGLAKRPADRVPSMLELARRLRATGLADAWTDERARSWWSTRAAG